MDDKDRQSALLQALTTERFVATALPALVLAVGAVVALMLLFLAYQRARFARLVLPPGAEVTPAGSGSPGSRSR